MSDTETTISLKRVIDAPADVLFAAWTDPALLEQWQADAVTFEAFEGGKFRFESTDGENAGAVHVVNGTVLKYEQDRLLVERWSFSEDGEPDQDSLLTVAFRALDDERTEIILTEDAPAHADPESRIFSIEAWDAALAELRELIE